MLNSSFFDTIKRHNTIVNKINGNLLILEAKILEHIERNPDIILYSYDPIAFKQGTVLEFCYPDLIITLSPFRMTIAYKDIITRLNGDYGIDNLESVMSKIVVDNIRSFYTN